MHIPCFVGRKSSLWCVKVEGGVCVCVYVCENLSTEKILNSSSFVHYTRVTRRRRSWYKYHQAQKYWYAPGDAVRKPLNRYLLGANKQ